MLDYVLKRDKEKTKFMSSTLIDFHFIIAKTAEKLSPFVFPGNKSFKFHLTLST